MACVAEAIMFNNNKKKFDIIPQPNLFYVGKIKVLKSSK